jgi:hypothetical protein
VGYGSITHGVNWDLPLAFCATRWHIIAVR